MGKTTDSDYRVDGLLYCGKCHTPKECEITLKGRKRKVACACDCEVKRASEENALIEKERNIRKLTRLKSLGFYDAKFQSWTFENDDQKNERLSNIARNYVKNFKDMKKSHKGLIFYGENGTGKSYISACIVNELIRKGVPCMMTNFSRISHELWKAEDKQAVYDKLNRNDLLVIDDFTAERQSEYMSEIVFNVIDERYRTGLPLIVTTNLGTSDFAKSGDKNKDRITSRITEMCTFIGVSGGDRRIQKMKEDREKLKEVLGL